MQRWQDGNGAMTGHTFHYSRLATSMTPACHATHPVTGERGEPVFRHRSIVATYMHAYWPSNPAFAAALFSRTRETGADASDVPDAGGPTPTRSAPESPSR
jgi:cobyrinic acid a,c-diamide synthase